MTDIFERGSFEITFSGKHVRAYAGDTIPAALVIG
jgi:hypothetical protein